MVAIATAAVDVMHQHSVSRDSSGDGPVAYENMRFNVADFQLAASREKCLELEMKLQIANDRNRKLEIDLQRSEDERMQEREHTRQSHEKQIKSIKRKYQKELGKLIEKYKSIL